MSTEKKEKPAWKKYLMWAAIAIGIIIVYNVIVGDDEEGTGSASSKISEMVEVVSQTKEQYAVKVRLKNISNKTINDTYRIRLEYTDGVSDVDVISLFDMRPGDIQEVQIATNFSRGTALFSSWKFVE